MGMRGTATAPELCGHAVDRPVLGDTRAHIVIFKQISVIRSRHLGGWTLRIQYPPECPIERGDNNVHTKSSKVIIRVPFVY